MCSSQLDASGIDPRDIPLSVCEMIEWSGITVSLFIEEQRRLLCTKYPHINCENLLSDLCQMALMAKDPDEELQLDVAILSENDHR